jgi:two-component system, OmpR family, sensor histidine kinase PrrB
VSSRWRSLRTRVTVAATAAVAVVLTAVGVVLVATYAHGERSTLDNSIRRRADRLRPPPPQFLLPPPPGINLDRALSAESGSFVRVIRGDQPVAALGDVPSGSFPLPRRLGFATVETAGGHWRTYTRPLPVGPGVQVQLAVDLGPLEHRIARVRRWTVLLGVCGVALTGLLAWLFGAVALRPLAALRGGAERVSTTRDLSTRLPAAGGAEEVDALASSLNAMLARLERSVHETEAALEATRRFAADAGHELRTPLTAIRANLDALERNPELTQPERERLLAEVASEHERLIALIDALQNLARGEAGGALPMEPVDMGELVDAAVQAARARHPGTSYTLGGSTERQLVGWEHGLRLLVDNLLENAARHGRADGEVEVSLADRDGAVVLAVDDDGPGVPAGERERIFERFTRGAGARGAGAGLGLALAAQQAALHGGDVRVEEAPGGGARFVARLRGRTPVSA